MTPTSQGQPLISVDTFLLVIFSRVYFVMEGTTQASFGSFQGDWPN